MSEHAIFYLFIAASIIISFLLGAAILAGFDSQRFKAIVKDVMGAFSIMFCCWFVGWIPLLLIAVLVFWIIKLISN